MLLNGIAIRRGVPALLYLLGYKSRKRLTRAIEFRADLYETGYSDDRTKCFRSGISPVGRFGDVADMV